MKRELSPSTCDQAEVIAFLSNPASYPGVERVERVETHGNLVFLAGNEAFKIKRAVRFDYMDFSTLEKRHAACLREIAVNSRCAADMYLGCVPIYRSETGTLTFASPGSIVEWAVRMRRFNQSDLLSTLAANGQVTPELATQLAETVFGYHQGSTRACPASGTAALLHLVASLSNSLSRSGVFDDQAAARLSVGLRHQLDRACGVLNERAQLGYVRRCHGDLHLANVVLWHNQAVLYDAIEFDDSLATIDTLYDLAFLLMDLDCQHLRPAANVVLNRYLWLSQHDADLSGLAALPLFLGLRAAVRAMVVADRASQENSQARAADLKRAQDYFQAALHYVTPPPPQLVVVAGLSGTGKTTLAMTLAPLLGAAPGAVHLRSDLERKALAGVDELSPLPNSAYSAEARERIYAVLKSKTQLVLQAGHCVVVDAVYTRTEYRASIEIAARSLGVAFRGLWLDADPRQLIARVSARHNDASDATPDVVQAQLQTCSGQLSPAWTVLDASGTAQDTLQRAITRLGIDHAP